MTRTVVVKAASRLHFGMLSFGQPDVRQYGGIGAMIDAPGVVVKLAPAEQFSAVGLHAERAATFARRAAEKLGHAKPLRCQVTVLAAPPEHAGLGLGTSLGLAVATAVAEWLGRPTRDPVVLSGLVDRGRRSAVGTYGFVQGGLILEAGKLADESLAPLVARVELPSQWRFLLLRPPVPPGLSGSDEQQAFAELPPVPHEVTAQLCQEALLHLVPAARLRRFDEFSQSVYRYGYLAGTCFATAQGGAYANERLTQLVTLLRRWGIAGVGQSSWGPTLFALLPDRSQAEALMAQLRAHQETCDLELTLAAPVGRGAEITVTAEDPTRDVAAKSPR